MSSIFSDPPFRRGSTLAGGDFGDAATSGGNILGGEIVGQIKAFQDVVPSTGLRLSNRLVYCMAVRWKGADQTDATSVAGQAYVVDLAYENGKPLATITGAATNAQVAAGRQFGVLDEYLTGRLKQNDVVWIVVKGPTAIESNASGATITSGGGLELTGSAGKAQAQSAGANLGIWLGTSPYTKATAVDASANYTTVTADITVPALRVSLIGAFV